MSSFTVSFEYISCYLLIISLDFYQLFFYADYGVPIEDSAFWQRGYQLRRKTKSDAEKHSNPGHTFSNEHSTGTSENILLSQKSSSRSTLEPGSPSQVLSSPKGKSTAHVIGFF